MIGSEPIIAYKILLIDSSDSFLESTSLFLQEKGYKVSFASKSNQGVEIAKTVIPDLILLDIDFTDIDEIETCQTLREIPELKNTLIVFASIHNEDYVQIACFKAGADDYFSKPIKNSVLLYRIQALLKRHLINTIQSTETILLEEDTTVEIDPEKYIVKVGSNIVNLPKKQFQLLQLLMSHPSKVFSRNNLLELIWGDKNIIGGRAIDVYIRLIREKIGDKHIVTIKGVGYRFDF